MKTKILLFTIALLLSSMAWGQIIHVPGDQPTIQAGINAAMDGDTVLVAENTYYENIRFMGKAITVTSEHILDGDSSHIVNTIIDGSQAADPDSAATVMFINGEDTTSILNGFTITGGSGVMFMTYVVRAGGGIFSYNAGCKILNNIITENHVEDEDKAGAAGIGCMQDQGDHWAIIRDNYIGYNTALANGFTAFGGGMAILSSCYIENNLIEHNTCTNTDGATDGGGIELEAFAGTNPIAYVNSNIIRNNELFGTTLSIGAGIACYGFDEAEITNNLIENNSADSDDKVRGGGIWIHLSDNCLVGNNIIQNNSLNGDKAIGGGIYSWQNDNLNINENNIYHNKCNAPSSWGGGICSLVSGKLLIQDNNISYNNMNSSLYWFGAGIWMQDAYENTYILDNQFDNNTGSEVSNWSLGGAIGIYDVGGVDSTIYVERNNIKNHSAERGGGIWAANAYNFYLANNIVVNNNASVYGGGICFEQLDEKSTNKICLPSEYLRNVNYHKRDEVYHPILVNNTFMLNSAPSAGAIYTRYVIETPIIFNSIFWENSANSGQDIYNYGGYNVLVFNNDIDTTLIYTPWDGADNIFCDPEFKNDSIHLDWPSLCVNAGIESLTFEDKTYYCPDQDIDGDERPYENTLPDIGADEAQWLYVSKFEHTVNTDTKLTVQPNPFSEATTIKFELLNAGHVKLDVYNSTGNQVETIVSESMLKGQYQFEWDASQLPAGMYFMKLNNGTQIITEKILKMR